MGFGEKLGGGWRKVAKRWRKKFQWSEAWAQFKFHWHSGMHTGRTQTAAAARPGPDYESRSDLSLPVRQAIDQAPWAVRG